MLQDLVSLIQAPLISDSFYTRFRVSAFRFVWLKSGGFRIKLCSDFEVRVWKSELHLKNSKLCPRAASAHVVSTSVRT